MEESIARKERLRALREAVEKSGDGDESSKPEPTDVKFRNYQPKTEDLKESQLQPATFEELKEPVEENEQDKEKDDEDDDDDDYLQNVAPKKANWDLKRDVESKLAKLERRTQRAIIEQLMAEEDKRRELEAK